MLGKGRHSLNRFRIRHAPFCCTSHSPLPVHEFVSADLCYSMCAATYRALCGTPFKAIYVSASIAHADVRS